MKDVTERFLRYVSVGTNSDPDAEGCPSTPRQLELGRMIAGELERIGLADVRQDEHGYVYGYLPGEGEGARLPAIGLIAHMPLSATTRQGCSRSARSSSRPAR